MLEYFTYKKFKENRDKKKEAESPAHTPKSPGPSDHAHDIPEPRSPILDDRDEAFFERVTSAGYQDQEEETPPPLPARPGTAQHSLEHPRARSTEAENVPLPPSPAVDDSKASKDKARSYWSYVQDLPKRAMTKRQSKAAGDTLASAAGAVKRGEGVPLNPDGTLNETEINKEERDLTQVLDQLNLAAVNNRVFSFSEESQNLLERWKQVLRDIVSGAPHAYEDLEQFLTGSEKQLDKMYNSLPPFVQNLVRSLPVKMAAMLGPEALAAAEGKQFDSKRLATEGTSKTKRLGKKAMRIPSLKRLVTEQGAIAAMLKSILNFLKLRFPAVVSGTNVLMSLAVFILLFVVWYCHKRGREVRLEQEAARQGSQSSLEKSASEFEDDDIILEPIRPTSIEEPDGPIRQSTEPPIHIHTDPAAPDKPSADVRDLPSVLHLPEPGSNPKDGGKERSS
ncbi:uncharacterized protein J3D65DRAFT_641085 [Phyllosticta citribraziliensis]|uniref:Ring-like domain-containing protein n=1 Tax=Phyllosticta citribraziliensis TaxID=989973 RepID=A0ABR1L6V1_9PEZI